MKYLWGLFIVSCLMFSCNLDKKLVKYHSDNHNGIKQIVYSTLHLTKNYNFSHFFLRRDNNFQHIAIHISNENAALNGYYDIKRLNFSWDITGEDSAKKNLTAIINDTEMKNLVEAMKFVKGKALKVIRNGVFIAVREGGQTTEKGLYIAYNVENYKMHSMSYCRKQIDSVSCVARGIVPF